MVLNTRVPDAQGDPDTQKVRQIRIANTFTCNEDFVDFPVPTGVSVGDPETSDYRREQLSEYVLIYGTSGTICPMGV